MKILIPLPNKDFDPSETAIPFWLLKEEGHQITFSTPQGEIAEADPIMVTGEGLGPLKGQLMARKDAVDFYRRMIHTDEFTNPIPYQEINSLNFDVLLLPGGHAKGVREYIESEKLHQVCSEFFEKNKVVGAVCHGVLLVGRSKNQNGQPILQGRSTTGLLRKQEMLAFNLTRLWMGDYYLTYPDTTVEDEMKEYLSDPKDFINGPLPISRDTKNNLKPGFAHVDGNYVSARWPGDIYTFSNELIRLIKENSR